jgi:integrase
LVTDAGPCEALGLKWSDIDFAGGIIRVQRQLGRQGTITRLKTPASRREVILAPRLETLLRQHRLASSYKAPDDSLFAAPDGRGIDYRNVGKEFRTGVKAAGVTHTGRLTLHSLRHTYASLLIASGLDVVFVSRQLGHANPTITLSTNAHLFQQADHAAKARDALDASYQAVARVAQKAHGKTKRGPLRGPSVLLWFAYALC